MPTYEYQCGVQGCDGEKPFTIVHGIKEPAREKCPFCGNDSLERLISQTTFIWKCSVPTPKTY